MSFFYATVNDISDNPGNIILTFIVVCCVQSVWTWTWTLLASCFLSLTLTQAKILASIRKIPFSAFFRMVHK
jgi:hypothetical protein